MSIGSVKTRRAHSRQHCRGARVYGQATTALHDVRTHTHPPLPLFSPRLVHVAAARPVKTRRDFFFFFSSSLFSGGWGKKKKVQLTHSSTYFRTRRVSISLICNSQSSWFSGVSFSSRGSDSASCPYRRPLTLLQQGKLPFCSMIIPAL